MEVLSTEPGTAAVKLSRRDVLFLSIFCGHTAKGSLRNSSKSVAQTVDRLTRVIGDRGFTLFRVIDHSGTAERVGVQMPDSKLVMFGKPTVGAAVMLAAPLAGLDLPVKVLVWEDGKGAVPVSYNAPGVPGRAAP
jgi:uncharacterized protein (DUF302 family)